MAEHQLPKLMLDTKVANENRANCTFGSQVGSQKRGANLASTPSVPNSMFAGLGTGFYQFLLNLYSWPKGADAS